MVTDPTSTVDEPVATDAESVAAGSSHAVAAPTAIGDLLRAGICALLVATCAASPDGALLVAPFVPVLVAIRMLRTRVRARRFLASATVLSLAAALGSSSGHPTLAWGFAAAMLLVPGLGMLHVQAALRDSATPSDAARVDWPEPRLSSGLSLALGGWVLAVLLILVLVAPNVDSPRRLAVNYVTDGYAPIVKECGTGGALEHRKAYCRQLLEQRTATLDLVRPHAAEVIAGLLALFAWAAALTAHPIVIARTWRTSSRVRPTWRLREFEVHWATAYVAAAGLLTWLLADGDGADSVLARSVAVFLLVIGSMLLVAQGVGLAAWLLTRVRTPTWYRVFLGIGAVLFLQYTILLLLVFGIVDMAVHPRRRAAGSASLPGRGSGS